MTRTKKPQRERRTLVPAHPRQTLERAIWQTYAGTNAPTPDEPIRVPLSERYTLVELLEVFIRVEWIEVPFDPHDHRIPDHPPSPDPVEGCNCAACTGEPRLNVWVEP